MNKEEAIRRLNELQAGGDKEMDHDEADKILLECVDPEIKKAWKDAEDRVGGFWYA